MNDLLSILGKSLAEEYRQNLSQWLPVNSLFSAEDVLRSFESFDELIYTEQKWDELSSLNQELETDFIPEGLVDGFFEKTGPEQGTEDFHTERKPTEHPFATSSKKNSLDEIFFENTDIQKQQPSFQNDDELKEAPGNLLFSSENEIQSESKKDKNVIDKFSKESSSFSREENSSLNDSDPFLKNDLTFSAKDELDVLKENGVAEKENQKPDSNRLIHTSQSAQPKAEREETNKENDISKSIWTAPLHNLSDFAGMVSIPVFDINGPLKPAENILNPSSENEEVKPIVNKPTTSGGSNFQDGWYHITDSKATQSDLNLPPYAPQQVQPLPVVKNGTQAENTAFSSQQQQQSSNADPDELLEALTERILRDFRRYYP